MKDKGMVVNLTPDIASFQPATAGVVAKFPDLFKPDLPRVAQRHDWLNAKSCLHRTLQIRGSPFSSLERPLRSGHAG